MSSTCSALPPPIFSLSLKNSSPAKLCTAAATRSSLIPDVSCCPPPSPSACSTGSITGVLFLFLSFYTSSCCPVTARSSPSSSALSISFSNPTTTPISPSFLSAIVLLSDCGAGSTPPTYFSLCSLRHRRRRRPTLKLPMSLSLAVLRSPFFSLSHCSAVVSHGCCCRQPIAAAGIAAAARSEFHQPAAAVRHEQPLLLLYSPVLSVAADISESPPPLLDRCHPAAAAEIAAAERTLLLRRDSLSRCCCSLLFAVSP